MIANSVSIYKKGNDEYIIKNSENGKYIKAGEKEVAYFLSYDNENIYEDVEVNKSAVDRLNDEEKKYLEDYFKKINFIVLDEIQEVEKKRKKLQSYIKDITVIRILNLNPNKLLNKTKRFFNCFFSIPALLIIIALIIAGEVSLIAQAKSINYDYLLHVDTFSVLLLMLSILPTAVIHELSHAVACKHYGGDVNRIGFLLFYFMPSFYADVSDIYLINRRKHRTIICLAGVISNLVIANIALITFSTLNSNGFTVKFLFYYYILNVGTAVYNLFPFVKMDGYWILQCLFNESNLMDKSKTMLYICVFRNRTYRNILDNNRNKKRIYLVCGILMSIFSILFWYLGVSTIYDLVFTNIGLLVARIVISFMLILIVTSTTLQLRMYRDMARDNTFSWG